jgi:hypothetical protein
MLTIEEATERVQKYLDEVFSHKVVAGDKNLVIMAIREYDFGWVFSYNSRTYAQTGDGREKLYGTGRIIIDKRNGSLHLTGTGEPLEYYIENYKQYGSPYPPN